MAKALTPNTVANLKPKTERYERPDGGCTGLLVCVFPSGKKSYVCRYRFKGKPKKLTLGPCLISTTETGKKRKSGVPLTLKSARALCADALVEAASGNDPAAAKQAAKQEPEANTLRDVCEKHLKLAAGLRTLDSQRRPDLELFYKTLGHLPIDQIKRSQFFDVLDQVTKKRGPRRAGRAFGSMKTALSWHGNRDEDFVNRLSRTTLPGGASGERDRTLDDDELRAVWKAADADKGPFGAFIRFVLLTAARRNEAADMPRSGELIDNNTGWLIPANRYKTKRDTLIPLSRAAQAIIAAMPDGDFLFSTDGTRPLRAFNDRKKAFDKVCGVKDWRLHDLRRTSRTFLSRAGVRPDIAELCLGHTVGGIRGRYDKFQFRKEKADAFEKLAALIEGIVDGVVVPMERRASEA